MKTYELTQEQINQLAEKKHAKKLLQEFFPDAFENKLEVGKWYKNTYSKLHIAFAEVLENNNTFYGYGFNANGKWFNRDGKVFGATYWELATKEEVREALINEFKKRLGKNKKVKTLKDKWEEPIIIEVNFEEFRYHSKENELWTSCKKTGIGYKVFDNGVWAKIIEESKTFDEDYLDNKITEIHSLLGDIKQYVNQLENEN